MTMPKMAKARGRIRRRRCIKLPLWLCGGSFPLFSGLLTQVMVLLIVLAVKLMESTKRAM
eukprot:CAMPEP_0183726850 /NCGR_PEP_ID=MMETSP0737-20130205/24345_1 /TAXON_ID=385413 /ORGANISM="Thalassiosira miniscula, Strain CCMP1093" /LENGTH=59 /DNA_ID=CAMNT_0025958321 /DNA_START=359 /DNA_END=538 /DNA_ORIENTATION=+